MNKVKGLLALRYSVCLMSLVTFPTFAAKHSFLRPLGSIAQDQLSHLYWVIGLCLIAVLPVLIAPPWILWRYRYANRKSSYKPHWTYNRNLEIAIWGFPAAIVLVLSIFLWNATTKLDPYKSLKTTKAPLCVEVIGLNWKWLFIYPQYHRATINTLIIPTDTPVFLRLTSDTVMQSFRVSALAGQIYVMPGMQTQLHFIANRTGEAIGENTQFSGEDFAQQQFKLFSVADTDWQKWLGRVPTSSLTIKRYHQLAEAGLAKQFDPALTNTDLQVPLYALAEPTLFDMVLQRYHQGNPLRETEQPGSAQFNALRATLPSVTKQATCPGGETE